jgi:hypothetical protein
MKKLFFTILIIIAVSGLAPAEDQMLFSGKITHGGFGAPVLKFTKIKDQNAVLIGGRGGWIINHAMVLGLGGYIMANENIDKIQISPGHSRFLSVGYGGFEVEYVPMHHRLFHPTLGILVGGGSASYIDKYNDDIDDDEDDFDGFFIVEPAANIELNVIPIMRANIGLSYRYVSGVEYYGLKDSDISGLAGSLSMKFGIF